MGTVFGAEQRPDTAKRRIATEKIMGLLGSSSKTSTRVADLDAVLDDVAKTMCYEVLRDGYYDGLLDRIELAPTGPGSGEYAYWILVEPVEPRERQVVERQRRGPGRPRPSRRTVKPLGEFTLMDDGTIRLRPEQFTHIMQRLEEIEQR